MAQVIIQDGITFNKVYERESDNYVVAGGIVKREKPEGASYNEFYSGNKYKIVEAPDIKWCEAQLPNANTVNGGNITINTTGQLLSLINEMQDEIYVLAAAVIALTQSSQQS